MPKHWISSCVIISWRIIKMQPVKHGLNLTSSKLRVRQQEGNNRKLLHLFSQDFYSCRYKMNTSYSLVSLFGVFPMMWALRHVSHPCRAQTDPPGRWISEAPLCLKGHLLLLGINSEWAARASEKLSKDPAMSPSPATLFIARPAQMSIIYTDTCKDCCHINNCVAKTEKKKQHTKLNGGSDESGRLAHVALGVTVPQPRAR